MYSNNFFRIRQNPYLPSYLFASSLVSNIHLMVDCGILSTVQFIVAVLFSLTVLLLEILEMVGWGRVESR
jgi:hypothetical protein